MRLDENLVRQQFPGLQRKAIFLDGPGGTQIANKSLNRMIDYLKLHNANHEGVFATSIESDEILNQAHFAMADLLNATSPKEIIFGNNMTSLTLHISRSIARMWNAGDSIVVTRLDHDANIMPWVLAAQDRGVKVEWVDFHPEDGTLDMELMESILSKKPRLVAVGYASNALGTINPVKKIIDLAHSVGSQVYIDAVQYAPHGPIDVQDLGCDFLVCSAYKFFGPHVGILFGRYDLLDNLMAYKVRPAPNDPPGKFETGTLNHEGIAGVLGAIEYLEWIGTTFGMTFNDQYAKRYKGRRLTLKLALAAIQSYEIIISRTMLGILNKTHGVNIYGLKDENRLEDRVPTYSFTIQGFYPQEMAKRLAQEDIYVWDGNYYALAVTEHLGLEKSGGMIRVGPVHYNTLEEIHLFKDKLKKLIS